jgi:hypothetical protein
LHSHAIPAALAQSAATQSRVRAKTVCGDVPAMAFTAQSGNPGKATRDTK